ncbi:hypothetical protein LSH36_180g05035 [Paralvinella palmiformis]|uniref:long-chain-fatty-acid--CoA ligase n=1 Tax=Paralvinella palmiformis TaxID=53620 RepID=A0AAD9N5M7_9ANNE|nr:hypothetical protein LSH36_180g05035 [Paralvinella palmiformis]
MIQYVAGAAGCLAALAYLLYKRYSWIKYDLVFLRNLSRLIIPIMKATTRGKFLCDLFEEHTDKMPKKTYIIFKDQHYTFQFVDKQMNKMGHAAMALGIKKGDTVALLMANEPAFIWTTYGDELIEAVEEIYPEIEPQGVKVYVIGDSKKSRPEAFYSLNDILDQASDQRPDRKCRAGITLNSTLCYIYTSGTTGLPKAAIITQMKSLLIGLSLKGIQLNKDDILYSPLPLYHSAGQLGAVGNTVFTGATLVICSKFSASHFIEECRRHNVTVIQYIGELCRYLLATPKASSLNYICISPRDKEHFIRAAFGNGLREDIWSEFQERFNIPLIAEGYIATEGNVGLINAQNRCGSIGRLSPLLSYLTPAYLIKYDVENDQPIRTKDGFCIEVGCNQPGLLVALIKKTLPFEGYKGDKRLTEKKILRDVFRKGDQYFNSGDLMSVDKDYFVYFKDRVGDTFRWKGENVSTIEVSNMLTELYWIEEANVYGVQIPGQDGRAGMASLTLPEGHELSIADLESLYQHCSNVLPSYAWPRFIRIQNVQTITSTFKLRKIELVRDGFDPVKVNPDLLYFLDLVNKSYVPMTDHLFNEIISVRVNSNILSGEENATVHGLDHVECSDNDYYYANCDEEKGLYYTGDDYSKHLASMHKVMIDYLIPSLKIITYVQTDLYVV